MCQKIFLPPFLIFNKTVPLKTYAPKTVFVLNSLLTSWKYRAHLTKKSNIGKKSRFGVKFSTLMRILSRHKFHFWKR